jgi:putative spermidine/putrescine transport system permease protein
MSAVRSKRRADDAASVARYALFAVTFLFLVVPVLVSVTMAFDARTYLGPFPPPALSLQWLGPIKAHH